MVGMNNVKKRKESEPNRCGYIWIIVAITDHTTTKHNLKYQWKRRQRFMFKSYFAVENLS